MCDLLPVFVQTVTQMYVCSSRWDSVTSVGGSDQACWDGIGHRQPSEQ